jgi:hypothetical protein
MRSPENYVARELMPEFATWSEMRRALERKYENLLTWSAVIAAHTERMKSKVA